MFPFHQNNDSLFQISCDLQEQDTVEQDLIWGQGSLEGSDPAQDMGNGGKQHVISPTMENNEASAENNEKKIIRRDIERERRIQMSTLCASLRSLLPLELIKGKRSVSDHIGEATKYIIYLKEKIHVLHIKRDKLRQMVNPSLLDTGIESSNRSSLVNCVKIDPFPGGVEIAIDSGFEESSPPLSLILEMLNQEGFNVVSCISTKVNGRIVHSIKSEVGCLTNLDLAEMQQKLNQGQDLSKKKVLFLDILEYKLKSSKSKEPISSDIINFEEDKLIKSNYTYGKAHDIDSTWFNP